MEDDKIYNVLKKTGLTRTEALVYLTLIKRGPCTAYRLSKEAQLYKANTYMAIDSLVPKNLVIKEEINKKQILRAVPPEELVKNLERQKEDLQAIIPLIPRSFKDETEGVSVFTGVNSLFNILYSLLEKKQPIYVFDIPSYVPDIVVYHIDKFHKERIKRKIAMYHIYDYNAERRIKYLTKLKYTYAKKGMKDRFSVTSTLVCGDTTLIINWKKGVRIVKIVDNDTANSYRNQFNILWNIR